MACAAFVGLALGGCSARSVVGTVGSATASVAGTAVGAAGSVASTAVSATGSAVGAGANAVGSAVSGSTAAAATTGAAAGTSGTVMTPAIAAGIGITGVAAIADYDAKTQDPATMAEGAANCLRAGADPQASGNLLTAAGWQPAAASEGRSEFVKGNVRGIVLSDGNCVFRSALITTPPVDERVRLMVEETFPKAKVKKPANKGEGFCDGFTLRQSRKNQAWVYYTDSTGNLCTGYGAGVVVQFL